MKKQSFFFLFILSIFVNLSWANTSQKQNFQKKQEIDLLLIKELVLKRELDLASKSQLYFLLNLSEKRLVLKARGLTLKEWKINRIRRWGPPPAIKIFTLERKSTLFAPKRKKIKPGKIQSEGTFELEALEVKDMPKIYTLKFNNGLKVYVRPGPKKIGGYLASIGFFLRWYGWFPIKNLFFQILKRPPKLIEITLVSGEDSKAIYWALFEGIKGLVFAFPDN